MQLFNLYLDVLNSVAVKKLIVDVLANDGVLLFRCLGDISDIIPCRDVLRGDLDFFFTFSFSFVFKSDKVFD